jgi:hypothetical protein
MTTDELKFDDAERASDEPAFVVDVEGYHLTCC